MNQDSKAYLEKKAKFERIITLYGRNSVAEVLADESVQIKALHLSNSNQMSDSIKTILKLAKQRNVEIKHHDKQALSRISKNAKQDQGVAIDIESKNYQSALEFLDNLEGHAKIIALDGIHNPQNLGMIIRSVAATKIDAIILPKKNSAKLSPLVHKASAGTLFKAKILYCDTLEEVLPKYASLGFSNYMLSSHSDESLFELDLIPRAIFVLGNESDGVSKDVEAVCEKRLTIPMQNGVESLNVAVTAALIAFSQG